MSKYKQRINKSKKDLNKYMVATKKPKYRQKYPKFSFKYYMCDDKKTSFECIKKVSKFYLLFSNFRKFCSITWEQIISNHNYHAHDIVWTLNNLPEAIKKLGDDKEIGNCPLIQFNPFKKGDQERIIGFFDKEITFQVLGILKGHKLYPGK